MLRAAFRGIGITAALAPRAVGSSGSVKVPWLSCCRLSYHPLWAGVADALPTGLVPGGSPSASWVGSRRLPISLLLRGSVCAKETSESLAANEAPSSPKVHVL